MENKLNQIKKYFLSLSISKKVMIICGSVVVLLGGGYAVSAVLGQSASEAASTEVAVVEQTTVTTTTAENTVLKELKEKVAKLTKQVSVNKSDKEALEKEIKDAKNISDKEKEDFLKQLEKVALVEETTTVTTTTTEAHKTEEQPTTNVNVVAENNSSENGSDSSNSNNDYSESSSGNYASNQGSGYSNSYSEPQNQPEPQPAQTQKYRLHEIGNSGMEFSTFGEAQAYAKSIFADKEKAVKFMRETGWGSWLVRPIIWSDGSTTYTVDFS